MAGRFQMWALWARCRSRQRVRRAARCLDAESREHTTLTTTAADVAAEIVNLAARPSHVYVHVCEHSSESDCGSLEVGEMSTIVGIFGSLKAAKLSLRTSTAGGPHQGIDYAPALFRKMWRDEAIVEPPAKWRADGKKEALAEVAQAVAEEEDDEENDQRGRGGRRR
jgi:hypothetical protein